jgi:flagellin-like protein
MRNLRRNRRGQSAVESGLVLVMFIFVLTGIADFGHFLYLHQTLTERVRVAARYGAVTSHIGGGNIDKIKNVAVFNTPSPAEGAKPLLPGLTTSMVNASLDGTFGQDDARIIVTIANYPFGFISPYMSTSTWYKTITASAPYEIP